MPPSEGGSPVRFAFTFPEVQAVSAVTLPGILKAPPTHLVLLKAQRQRTGTCSLAVVLAQGRRIEVKRGFDAETLARLIRTLEEL
jgi:hypothetical protein